MLNMGGGQPLRVAAAALASNVLLGASRADTAQGISHFKGFPNRLEHRPQMAARQSFLLRPIIRRVRIPLLGFRQRPVNRFAIVSGKHHAPLFRPIQATPKHPITATPENTQ
jgi:hypothetical protein